MKEELVLRSYQLRQAGFTAKESEEIMRNILRQRLHVMRTQYSNLRDASLFFQVEEPG